jgi:hypothetical protein
MNVQREREMGVAVFPLHAQKFCYVSLVAKGSYQYVCQKIAIGTDVLKFTHFLSLLCLYRRVIHSVKLLM